MINVPKIVLSGGPSGGKTKALRFLEEHLKELGFDVFAIKESAEAIIGEGFDRSSPPEFQKAIAMRQLQSENNAEKSAQDCKKPVIISDRGLMDSKVYLNDKDFEEIKTFLNMSDIDMRDRYDAVFHLDSTSGNENVKYKTSELRTESREEASVLNERSLRAWCGNPHYRFIPVCDTFDEKKDILFREVEHFLGIPKPLEIERKFLIEFPDIEALMKHPCSMVEITQNYMHNEGQRFRLRKRGADGNYIYIKTEKFKISDTVRVEIETRLDEFEYQYLRRSNINGGTISKKRYCLMYGGTYYEIDVFPFWKKQAYLEVELLNEDDKIVFPDFIKIKEEVTYKPEYKNLSLCHNVPPEE